MKKENTRRHFLKEVTVSSIVGASVLSGMAPKPNTAATSFNHSVARWCFNELPIEKLMEGIRSMGLLAIDLADIKDLPKLKAAGFISSMTAVSNEKWTIRNGWNNTVNHQEIIEWYKVLIDETAKYGFTNVICFSGDRSPEINDDQGLENCAEGLSKIIPYAESKGITLHMELLNSKIDHKNYMCDTSDWGVELVTMLDSERFKLLYDIYHMQIMEGDIIRTIKENSLYIGHYHVAGVPGRHEPDLTQELYYPAIIKAINETGFKGYIAQEFIPTEKGNLNALKKAIDICSV